MLTPLHWKSSLASRHVLLVTIAAFAGLAAFAPCASAVTLGGSASSGTTGSGNINQFAFQPGGFVAVPGTYIVPSNGVLTSFEIRTGASVLPGDTAQLTVLRSGGGGGGSYTLISKTLPLPIPVQANTAVRLPSNLAVQTGDLLGLVLTSSSTVLTWASPEAQDQTSSTGPSGTPPAVGGVITAAQWTPVAVTSRRLNLSVDLEVDADGDLAGDVSQDTCLGDATRASTACTGVLLGSNFKSPMNAGSGCMALI